MADEKKYTLPEIREICLAYDRWNGPWPESEFEGLMLWLWFHGYKNPKHYDDASWQDFWKTELDKI